MNREKRYSMSSEIDVKKNSVLTANDTEVCDISETDEDYNYIDSKAREFSELSDQRKCSNNDTDLSRDSMLAIKNQLTSGEIDKNAIDGNVMFDRGVYSEISTIDLSSHNNNNRWSIKTNAKINFSVDRILHSSSTTSDDKKAKIEEPKYQSFIEMPSDKNRSVVRPMPVRYIPNAMSSVAGYAINRTPAHMRSYFKFPNANYHHCMVPSIITYPSNSGVENAILANQPLYQHLQNNNYSPHNNSNYIIEKSETKTSTATTSIIAKSTPSKRKRSWSRAVFSQLQRKGLEIQFQMQKYITKPDRRKLAARLGLTDAQVKVWFQNRRMKWRHSRETKLEKANSKHSNNQTNDSATSGDEDRDDFCSASSNSSNNNDSENEDEIDVVAE